MEKAKRILKKLLFPHAVLILLLTVLSAAGLTYVFTHAMNSHPVAYVIYLLSFYTLCVVVAAAPPAIRKLHKKFSGSARTIRYLEKKDKLFGSSLYTGTIINLSYAAFKLFTGIYYRSVWFGAAAVYYMVLSLIRFSLTQNNRKIKKLSGKTARKKQEWIGCRSCGWLLLLLNVAITGMVIQMVHQNKSYTYPGYVIYVAASYTFYRLTMSIIRTAKLKKSTNPTLIASTAIDFSAALMSIFTLQTAMFASFGADTGDATRKLMNAITGSAVSLLVVCLAVFMIVYPWREIKKLRINKT